MQPERKDITTLRVVRDTKKSREIKELYEYRCQICGLQIEGPGGRYAEAAHIRPLGRLHNGPDAFENLMCLCPNHHAMFDLGVFTINDDLYLNGVEGRLSILPQHRINSAHLQYHREHYGNDLVMKTGN
jgi:putative restriction endonuclease